jgi:hypothetical protein
MRDRKRGPGCRFAHPRSILFGWMRCNGAVAGRESNAIRPTRSPFVIPGCAVRRRPGIHNHNREYGFRTAACRGFRNDEGAVARMSEAICGIASEALDAASLMEPLPDASHTQSRLAALSSFRDAP